ncbi:MAG: hypothetical protein LBK06_04275 [Planctomycetaceae bacterium]|jgi:hypothetical protein|nr:hypothetical protein [Planctomycetaceae bacterium]
MERKEKYNVLKDIRRIRKQRYEETKNMSGEECMEYYRKLIAQFEMHMKEIDPDYKINWAVKE